MKKLILLILMVAIAVSIFANDFQGMVYEFKSGPKSYKNLEFQFLEDSLLIIDLKQGTYTQVAYCVEGGTIYLEGEQSSSSEDSLLDYALPYALKDGTAILELTIDDEVLILYDTGRKQYRSDLAFGIIDKAVASSALVAGTVSAYQKTNKFYKMDKYVKSNNGKVATGYKGGTRFRNDKDILPSTGRNGATIMYREYDVNPYVRGVNRGIERLVVGIDGLSYMTFDHYHTFYRI